MILISTVAGVSGHSLFHPLVINIESITDGHERVFIGILSGMQPKYRSLSSVNIVTNNNYHCQHPNEFNKDRNHFAMYSNRNSYFAVFRVLFVCDSALIFKTDKFGRAFHNLIINIIEHFTFLGGVIKVVVRILSSI